MSKSLLSRLNEALLKGIKMLIALLAAVLIIVVFSNVIFRYFLNYALAWAEETARFLFIWLSFLGAVLANAYSEHMNFDLLVKKAPKKVGYILSIIAYVVILIVLSMIVRGGTLIVIGSVEWLSSALEIPYGYVYSIVPICAFILALQFFARLFNTVKLLLGSSKKATIEEGL